MGNIGGSSQSRVRQPVSVYWISPAVGPPPIIQLLSQQHSLKLPSMGKDLQGIHAAQLPQKQFLAKLMAPPELHWLISSMFSFSHKYCWHKTILKDQHKWSWPGSCAFLSGIQGTSIPLTERITHPAFQSRQIHKAESVPFSKGPFSQATRRNFPVPSWWLNLKEWDTYVEVIKYCSLMLLAMYFKEKKENMNQ